MFARNGRFGRGGNIRGTLYEEVLNIPLIIKIPHQKGERINGLVQIIDIMPTVLGLLDISLLSERQGKNLIPFIEDNVEKINEYVFTGTIFGLDKAQSPVRKVYGIESTSESLRNDEWKLIHEIKVFNDGNSPQETYELYNLKDDPGEADNLIEENTVVAEELKRILVLWQNETRAYVSSNTSNPNVLPEEIIEAVKAGGYR
jgi:arylsulfatase A-like enzyme